MIVSIAGQMKSGKNALASYLSSQLGDCRIIAFADAMKNVLCESFGVDRDFVEQWKRQDLPPEGFLMTIRESLQLIGNDFRKIKPSVWIDLVIKEASKESVIIADGRYDNESLAVKQNGGLSVLLYRPGFDNQIDHPSESEVGVWVRKISSQSTEDRVLEWEWGGTPLFDLFINNNGTMMELYEKADRLIIPRIKESM